MEISIDFSDTIEQFLLTPEEAKSIESLSSKRRGN